MNADLATSIVEAAREGGLDGLPRTDYGWSSPEHDLERRNRIRLAAYAYAYEVEHDPIASDAEFDALAVQIRPQFDTGLEELDAFFRTRFAPHTGLWVHSHPGKDRLADVCARIREGRALGVSEITNDMDIFA